MKKKNNQRLEDFYREQEAIRQKRIEHDTKKENALKILSQLDMNDSATIEAISESFSVEDLIEIVKNSQTDFKNEYAKTFNEKDYYNFLEDFCSSNSEGWREFVLNFIEDIEWYTEYRIFKADSMYKENDFETFLEQQKKGF